MTSPDAQRAAADQRNAVPETGRPDKAVLEARLGGAALASRPTLFSASRLHVAQADLDAMAAFAAAMEAVAALPAWRELALAQAPASAAERAGIDSQAAVGRPLAASAFMGYDFHLSPAGPRLIEINTNAGGALLMAALLDAWQPGQGAALEEAIAAMFAAELAREGMRAAMPRAVVVDEAPAEQYLAPEFALTVDLLARHGWQAAVADPSELAWDGQRLIHQGQPVDLVYNRLTDFYLEAPASQALRQAWRSGAAVITPHPAAHALFADKRLMTCLSDAAWLAEAGADAATRAAIAACVAETRLVTPDNADALWGERRRWFFKPAAGFGSRAAYRGDKLTKRVFEEIVAASAVGGYVAQALVPPSTRAVTGEEGVLPLKVDVRNYAYAGQVQLVAARLYQGQTTNFRTPGGGFAPVLGVAG